ncbi:MAG: hypothetical protein JXN61_07040 [Sedimentisphaerales bacterium]|nr:hypothetical protein [Sedimentisphaerales bacterium]
MCIRNQTAYVLSAIVTALVATAAPGACTYQPDAPDCSCFDNTGAWAPTGTYIQDIALDMLGTKESCPCPGTTGCNWEISPTEEFSNAGKPYYQIVLGANSEDSAWFISWMLSAFGNVFDGRQAWCSETISYWHREAGIPNSQGYRCWWHSDWQIGNVSSLRTWYEVSEYISSFGGGWGRWIAHDELDYENFELGVTVPVPGSYLAIRGYTLGSPNYWQDLDNSHSQMIDEMWVHKDILGNVFQIEVTLLEGNSGNRVRNDHSYSDLWSVTPSGPDWVGSDRKIYGFGVDLDADRNPIYDASRLHYVHHNNLQIVPAELVNVLDREWDIYAQRIPLLRAYAEFLAEQGGPKLTCSSPRIRVTTIPDGNEVKWYFPNEQQEPVEILIDLLDVHPLPIMGVELTWNGQFIPTNYAVQYSSDGEDYVNGQLPKLGGVQFPEQMEVFPVPASFSNDEQSVAARYVRILFPAGAFVEDAIVESMRFRYEPGPGADAEDNPPCEREIPGDINKDCIVNFKDLAILAAHWLEESE